MFEKRSAIAGEGGGDYLARGWLGRGQGVEGEMGDGAGKRREGKLGSDKEVSAGNLGIRRVCVIGFQLRVFAPLPYLPSPGSQFTKLM